MVPGWPYSVVAALETGRRSWTALLDAVRLLPGADVAAVTTDQIRGVVERLIAAGQWREGDPAILVVLDAGYDAPRIAHLLADLPVEILGRMRSDRVLARPAPPRVPATSDQPGRPGRPPKHGGEFVFGDPTTWGTEQAVTTTDTRLYGTTTAQAWDQLHPRLTRRAAWTDHDRPLPVIEGTVIRVECLQLADLAASATGAAFHKDEFGNTEIQYLQGLAARLYRRNGTLLSYGLKLHPGRDSTKAAYPWGRPCESRRPAVLHPQVPMLPSADGRPCNNILVNVPPERNLGSSTSPGWRRTHRSGAV